MRTSSTVTDPCAHGICPWYLGYLLASPLRRLFENPEAMLGPFVKPGMTVLEPGCGMGYFSLPLARLVGAEGRVICVDLQPKMIDGLKRRARKAGLLDRIAAGVCGPHDLGIEARAGSADLALAIHVVHEVPDTAAFLRQIHTALRPGGRLVIIEPKGHVTEARFEETIAVAGAAGFTRLPEPFPGKRLGVVLARA